MTSVRASKRLAAGLLTLLMTIAALWPAYAAVNTAPVRVGFFAFDGYHMKEEQGVLSGYGYDVLQYMAGLSDLEFDYIGYDASWSQAQNMLEKGEIDVLTSAQKTKERLEKFDFSDKSIGTSAAILTVCAGNTTYLAGDYSNWNGMRVGMIRDNSRNDHFAAFALNHGFTYESEYFDDTDDMLFALKTAHTIDAVVTSNLRRTKGEWMLAQFNPSPFYIMVQKGNSQLLARINAALDKLYVAAPDFQQVLMDKYYRTQTGDSVALTLEESALIERSKRTPVNIGIIPSGEPVCYMDKTGEYMGISMDILRAISSKTELAFNYIPIESQTVPFDDIRAGKIDVASGIISTLSLREDPSILLSNEIMTDSIVIIGRKNDDFSKDSAKKVIAASIGFKSGLEYIETYFPEYKVKTYSSFNECLKAVVKGEADATAYFRNRATYMLMNPHYENLAVIPSHSMEFSYCVAGFSPDAQTIINVVNKGASMITESERNAIMLNYTILNSYELSFGDMLFKYRFTVIAIATLLIIILVLFILYSYKGRKNAKTLEAAYKQTKDALAQTEAATKAKSDFLARMSHDIRTPMNAIVGLTEIAKQYKNDTDKIDDYLRKIELSSKMLLNLINDILDMSAIEAGRLKIANMPFDIKQILASISTIYYAQCQNKGVDFNMEIDIKEEMLRGDELRVEQILLNLVSNAFKFTPRGGRINIRVKETVRRDDTAFIRFTVTDTGCGMSEEMTTRMFEPFEQESADTARKHGGSGLGLSIVKNLVEMMYGAISVDSKVGYGTTIYVDLPFGILDENPVLSSDALNKLHILTVDDDATALEYTAIVLRRIGVRFDTARSGEEALSMIADARGNGRAYNVCLIDWKMHGMDGIELTRRIRETEEGHTIIIIVSAYDLNEISQIVGSDGADHLVSKPLFQSTVFNVLMSLVGGHIKLSDAPDEEYDFTGCRALLAEDQMLNAEIAIELLRFVGLEVDHVENGKEAVERFAQNAPGTYNVILMDIQMPVMDGYDATRAIRAMDRADAKEIPILAMTANAFSEDVTASLSAGMNGHIAKPIQTDILFGTLAKCLRRK